MGNEENEIVWVKGDYILVKETDKAIGISTGVKGARGGYDIQSWFPKSKVGRIRYADGEMTEDIREGEKIEGIEVEEWLAEKKQQELDAGPTPAEKDKEELDSNEW